MSVPSRPDVPRPDTARISKLGGLALLLVSGLACASADSGLDPNSVTGGVGGAGTAGQPGPVGGAGGSSSAGNGGTGGARPGGATGGSPAGDAGPPGMNPPAPGTDAAPLPPDAPPPPDVRPSARSFRLVGVSTWRGDAKAAYSLIHDDICDPSAAGAITNGAPALERRGFRGGFGVIVERCASDGGWQAVRGLLAGGHDVFNHSWDHPCMTDDANRAVACDPAAPKTADFGQQIDRSSEVFRAEAGTDARFFIFPYDVCDPRAIDRLRAAGYLGARCGSRTVNDARFSDSFALAFDVWGPAYSIYGMGGVCSGVQPYQTPPAQASGACRTHVLSRYVEETISRGGWGIRELHGFQDDPGSWEAITVADYETHLDFLRARAEAGDLWVEGPTTVLKYRWARERCPQPRISGSALSFDAPSAECQKHATVVTYVVATDDGSAPQSLAVQQGSNVRPARALGGGRFAVDADPTAGPAMLVE